MAVIIPIQRLLKMKSKPSKNSKQLISFVSYCVNNPEQRFFQALRNWDKSAYILRQKKFTTSAVTTWGEGIEDTFYD